MPEADRKVQRLRKLGLIGEPVEFKERITVRFDDDILECLKNFGNVVDIGEANRAINALLRGSPLRHFGTLAPLDPLADTAFRTAEQKAKSRKPRRK